jgi:Spy/CpxP family protein refolding chaperone
MNRLMRTTRNALLAVLIAGASPLGAMAFQDPPRQPPQTRQPGTMGQRGRGQGLPPARAGMAIPQLQALFDAHVLVQAQRILGLSDEQYQRFFMRMNRLQEVRRQHIRRRNQLLNELRRKWRPETNEAELVALTKQIDDAEATFDNDQRTARRAIDEVLTPRQVAQFRFFEEDMERQKIEYITRARQGGGTTPAPGRQGGGGR